jgi:hypothetical protein
VTRLIYFFALASGLVAGFAIPVTADVTGWFWEKTGDNGNKLFAVCTPAVAEQDGLSQCGHFASLLYHRARRSTPLESSVYRLLRSNECPFRA